MPGRVLGALILVVEAVTGTYLTWISFMMSGWMIDDSIAFRLAESGWRRIALLRVALWIGTGIVFWVAVVLVNRLALSRLGLNAKRASFAVGLAGALAITVASIIGAVRFVSEKPFI